MGAYAGLLSAVGLGFVVSERVHAWLLVIAVALAVLSAGVATRRHKNPAPMVITVAGAVAALAGHLLSDIAALVYSGVVLLGAASLWNARIGRRHTRCCDVGERHEHH
jgi:hypothetical protein